VGYGMAEVAADLRAATLNDYIVQLSKWRWPLGDRPLSLSASGCYLSISFLYPVNTPPILPLLLDRGLSALVSTGKRAMRPILVYE